MKIPKLISWLPHTKERELIVLFLQSLRKGQSRKQIARELNEVLDVLEKAGYGVAPRGLLDAVYKYGKSRKILQ